MKKGLKICNWLYMKWGSFSAWILGVLFGMASALCGCVLEEDEDI